MTLKPILLESEIPGYYGIYGGSFIPEILHSTLEELTTVFQQAKGDPLFWEEYLNLMQSYSGRPTPITFLPNFSAAVGGPQVYCKREDLNHTGSHKINNAMGQGLLVRRMGKTRVIAETGAGQHGVATATMAARFGFECTIYMGAIDVERQRPNVFWMEQMGATVISVTEGTATLKDAINAALRDWATNMDSTHYVLGTACGAHPFPQMVAYFHSVIGQESRQWMLDNLNRLPTAIYACVGGGSNACGIFLPFLKDPVELVGIEAAGEGIISGKHAARFQGGSVGIAQGYKTYFLQNKEGQMLPTHSVAAGLDYIGVSPILSDLHDQKRVHFDAATDQEVIDVARLLMKTEGIIPALETSHAFAGFRKNSNNYQPNDLILINLSGRGDKDIFNIAEALHDEKWEAFLRKKVGL